MITTKIDMTGEMALGRLNSDKPYKAKERSDYGQDGAPRPFTEAWWKAGCAAGTDTKCPYSAGHIVPDENHYGAIYALQPPPQQPPQQPPRAQEQNESEYRSGKPSAPGIYFVLVQKSAVRLEWNGAHWFPEGKVGDGSSGKRCFAQDFLWRPIASPTTPDEGQWIEWKGGDCPVPKGAKIEIRRRDGRFGVFEANINEPGTRDDAGPSYWLHEAHPADIIAYRLANPTPRQGTPLPADHPHAALQRLWLPDETMKCWALQEGPYNGYPIGSWAPIDNPDWDELETQFQVSHVHPEGA